MCVVAFAYSETSKTSEIRDSERWGRNRGKNRGERGVKRKGEMREMVGEMGRVVVGVEGCGRYRSSSSSDRRTH